MSGTQRRSPASRARLYICARHAKARGRRLVGRKERAHFIHIGKTGGTALKEALRPVSTAGRYEIVLHSHKERLRDFPRGEKYFFAVRDPVERYVSGFNSRLRQGRPRYDRPWTAAERVVFEEFPSPDALARGLSSVDGDVRVRAYDGMMTLTHVRDTYWQWFGHRKVLERRRGDLLLAIWSPDMTAVFPRLRGLLELPEAVELPTNPVSSHRTPESVSTTMSAEAITNLGWWYARDYAFLNYCSGLEAFAGPSFRNAVRAGDVSRLTAEGP